MRKLGDRGPASPGWRRGLCAASGEDPARTAADRPRRERPLTLQAPEMSPTQAPVLGPTAGPGPRAGFGKCQHSASSAKSEQLRKLPRAGASFPQPLPPCPARPPASEHTDLRWFPGSPWWRTAWPWPPSRASWSAPAARGPLPASAGWTSRRPPGWGGSARCPPRCGAARPSSRPPAGRSCSPVAAASPRAGLARVAAAPPRGTHCCTWRPATSASLAPDPSPWTRRCRSGRTLGCVRDFRWTSRAGNGLWPESPEVGRPAWSQQHVPSPEQASQKSAVSPPFYGLAARSAPRGVSIGRASWRHGAHSAPPTAPSLPPRGALGAGRCREDLVRAPPAPAGRIGLDWTLWLWPNKPNPKGGWWPERGEARSECPVNHSLLEQRGGCIRSVLVPSSCQR